MTAPCQAASVSPYCLTFSPSRERSVQSAMPPLMPLTVVGCSDVTLVRCPSCRVRRLGGFRFPPEIIVLAVRWYLRFGLSYRDLEELLAERWDRGRSRRRLPVGAAVYAA